MSKIEVNQISSQCGSTLTIGQSGDSIQLACGATQTGFGRTGTVDWDTTAKTASFTAVSGNGYFVNTTSGAITVTLPATPNAGDIVAVKDYANTADTNNITIARNGSNIDGTAENPTITNEGGSVTLVYVDATKGWLVTDSAQKSDIAFPEYIVATGGTVTCCGDYKIHTFTGPGTFTVTCAGNPFGSETVDYLVIAGGGGGGASSGFPSDSEGGGGGAGGYRESSGTASGCYTTSPLGACVSALPVTATSYPITVGGGGNGSTTETCAGVSGSNSVFSTIISTGGGGGGSRGTPPGTNCAVAGDGGSGGGAGQADSPTSYPGSGNTPPVSPPQGNDGGNAAFPSSPGSAGGGGGGGATASGGNATPGPSVGGDGGAGATSSINGTPTGRSGGGGGAGPTGGTATSGGGNGNSTTNAGGAGTTNTGGGGGGSGPGGGGNGGSGIVIIRYKYQ